MIGGVGVDVVHIPAFRGQLSDRASCFASATFTELERQVCAQRCQPDASLAARFAAKEAFVKAWSGTRFGQPRQVSQVDFREIEVVQDNEGRPSLRLHGTTAQSLQMLPGAYRVHLSLSHDGDTATAFVVLEF